MKSPTRCFLTAIVGTCHLTAILSALAAPIPGLFSTGVSDTGALIESGEVDPHYTLTASADEIAVGPETFSLIPGFPVGPWLAEGPDSKWIAPQADQSVGNAPGVYTFTTTFQLTGLDPATAQITGSLGTDNDLPEVRLNGTPIPGITTAGFGALTAFTIPAGSPFIDGLNTLEFDVSNAGDTPNPVGIRVQMTGRATGPNEAPQVLLQPLSQSALVGDTVTFRVEASGTPPLTFQWQFQSEPLPQGSESTLTLSGLTTNQSGLYRVLVTNASGQTNSTEARLTVLVPFPGIYDTGTDTARALLADGVVDPHYRLTVNADIPDSADAYAQATIPSPPWLTNSLRSRWIGPAVDAAASGGNYTYELLLDLTGYDPTTAFLEGDWAADDEGSIFLNGADTGFRSLGFATFSSFSITNGFVSGPNVLAFRVVNGGANPTGLRVERLRGTAQAGGASQSAPSVVTQPQSVTRVLTDGVTLTVVADGTSPLHYQWFHENAPVADATNSVLNIASAVGTDAGTYFVAITNVLGSTNSAPATVTVIVPQVGIFNTGADSSGLMLPTGAPDPHYVLLSSADPAHPVPTAYVTAGPIPPWVANDEDSAWIAPRADAADAAPGTYRYRLIFPIDNPAEVATAEITANIGTDDGNGGAFLNGVQVELGGTGFGSLIPFTIPAGGPFRQDLNTIDFVVVNGGNAANPTGLRVDDLVLTGVSVRPALSIVRNEAEVRLSWPAAAGNWILEETVELPAGWTASTATVAVEGTENVARIPPSGSARYYRLRQ